MFLVVDDVAMWFLVILYAIFIFVWFVNFTPPKGCIVVFLGYGGSWHIPNAFQSYLCEIMVFCCFKSLIVDFGKYSLICALNDKTDYARWFETLILYF